MEYKLREGVAFLRVCGANLLVPSRVASPYCKGILTLNFIETMICSKLQKGETVADAAEIIGRFAMKSAEEIMPKVQPSIDKLCKYGFLIPAEDEHGSD